MMMSPASALEELETRAHLTMAEVSRARVIFRQPRSPKSIARAWHLVATVRASVAFAECDLLDKVAASETTLGLVVQILQLSYDKVREFAHRAINAGLGAQEWHRALREALEALEDALEGLYLARDPEFRAMVNTAIQELSPASEASDWRAALAAMPD